MLPESYNIVEHSYAKNSNNSESSSNLNSHDAYNYINKLLNQKMYKILQEYDNSFYQVTSYENEIFIKYRNMLSEFFKKIKQCIIVNISNMILAHNNITCKLINAFLTSSEELLFLKINNRIKTSDDVLNYEDYLACVSNNFLRENYLESLLLIDQELLQDMDKISTM